MTAGETETDVEKEQIPPTELLERRRDLLDEGDDE